MKTTFSKLNLKANTTTKTFDWTDTESFEVKMYLPIEEKLNLIQRVINQAQSADTNDFINPLKLDMYLSVEMLYTYTNISFTAKQKENPQKIYDEVLSTGLLEQVFDLIPPSEFDSLRYATISTIHQIYKYRQSALGILDTVSQDYSNLDLDATAIQSKLGDKENMGLLRDVLTKLG